MKEKFAKYRIDMKIIQSSSGEAYCYRDQIYPMIRANTIQNAIDK